MTNHDVSAPHPEMAAINVVYCFCPQFTLGPLEEMFAIRIWRARWTVTPDDDDDNQIQDKLANIGPSGNVHHTIFSRSFDRR